jgi:hypothetical protein
VGASLLDDVPGAGLSDVGAGVVPPPPPPPPQAYIEADTVRDSNILIIFVGLFPDMDAIGPPPLAPRVLK